ncbi:uncharacterized protein [Palaemon carinicauda]|uniref:uncharacterized protein n=1 Tax=Palaemon carinicauda TaxID=392227 RepID=UPI0035B66D8D
MTSATSLLVWIVNILFIIGQTEGGTCSSGQINCKSGNQCISISDVCNRDSQCADGSDEDPRICSFWRPDPQCGTGQYSCQVNYRRTCISLQNFCDRGCSGQDQICQLMRNKILKLEGDKDLGMSITQELVSLMQQAVNSTTNDTTNYSESCPMFYSQVGNACLSFFSPAKVPWPEARQFCLSIGGDLVAIKGFVSHEKLIEYMMMSHFTTDYWIGGRFDVDTNAWSWVNDDTPLPLGSPFWATRYSSSCVPRAPPHTDPFSPAPRPLPKAPCFHYLQAPAQRSSGWCAAITYEHYYYFTDEECQEERSPLCLYTGKPRHTDKVKIAN